jgi:hypothetical protein
MRRWLLRYTTLALVALVGGCVDSTRERILRSPPAAETEPPLIDRESRTHHFGAVISSTDRKLVHRYRLANSAKHDIRIVELINRKPCCGDLSTGKTTLRPGDETEVEVKLSVRQEFGDIVHEAVVLTEPPQSEELVLRTVARAYPPIRIEEVTPIDGSVILSRREPKRVEFRVFAHGSSIEPPVDLDRLEIRSTIKVDWAGRKEESPSDDGLRIESRRFTASLDSSGPPGEHKAEILLRDGEQDRYRHVVNWEVASPISASPKLIVIKPGQRDYRIFIQSHDQNLFRITRIECKMPDIQGRAADTRSALSQVVEVKTEGVPTPRIGRGMITVFTDHPAQGKVDLPFVVID